MHAASECGYELSARHDARRARAYGALAHTACYCRMCGYGEGWARGRGGAGAGKGGARAGAHCEKMASECDRSLLSQQASEEREGLTRQQRVAPHPTADHQRSVRPVPRQTAKRSVRWGERRSDRCGGVSGGVIGQTTHPLMAAVTLALGHE